MYANLEVRVKRNRLAKRHPAENETPITFFHAWYVKFERDHVVIGIDKHDGGSNYAEPGRPVRLALRGRTVDIGADF